MTLHVRQRVFVVVLLAGCTSPGSEAGESGEPAPTMLLEATQISSSQSSRCAETLDGSLACWGSNYVGQLGDGTLEFRLYPVAIELDGVAEIELEGNQSCARTDAGRLYCWGDGAYGQLGDGVALDQHKSMTPTEVPGLVDVVDVSVSGSSTCAVLGDGSVWCWGSSEFDDLGVPSETCGPYWIPGKGILYEEYVPCVPNPTQVPGIVDAVEVSTSFTHRCARHQDGSVSCWGSFNEFGTLGDGTTMQPETVEPRPVLGLVDVVQLKVGDYASCALVEGGTVWCWGNNAGGMLGVGEDTPFASEPLQVPDLTDVTRISVTDMAACAMTEAGDVSCWGDVGDTFPPQRFSDSIPTPIALPFGVAAVDVDSSGPTTCIVDVDNHVRCLGHGTGNGSPDPDFSNNPAVWDG